MSWDKAEHCERLFRFDRRMRSIRYHLAAIEHDIELSMAGWKINYAVDYCELYRYAFPLYRLLSDGAERLLIESERREVVDKTAAMALLLKGIGLNERIILLPSYAVELNEFLNNISSSQKVIIDYIERAKSAPSMLEDHDKEILEKFIRCIDESENIPKDIRIDTLNLLIRQCRELLFMWLSALQPGVSLLRNIIGDKAKTISTVADLIKNDDAWSETGGLLKNITLEQTISGKWFEMLQKVRNRYISDLIDAIAMESIERLNSHLIKKKQVVLILSDAPTMTRTLNWDIIDIKPPEMEGKPRGVICDPSPCDRASVAEYRMLRTPRTFMFYLLCLGNSPKDTLSKVLEHRIAVDDYFSMAAKIIQEVKGVGREIYTDELIREEMLKSCKFYDRRTNTLNKVDESICAHCANYAIRDKLAENLKSHERTVKEFENASIYSNMEKFIGELVKSRRDILEQTYENELGSALKKFAHMMIRGNLPLKNDIDKKRSQLIQDIEETRKSITSCVIMDASAQTVDDFRYKLDQYIRIFGRIGFKDERITRAIENLRRSFRRQKERIFNIGEDLYKLYELSKRSDTSVPEAGLLKATLAFLNDQLPYCLEKVRVQLSMEKCPNVFGARLLVSCV
jgi:hypothetical protein